MTLETMFFEMGVGYSFVLVIRAYKPILADCGFQNQLPGGQSKF